MVVAPMLAQVLGRRRLEATEEGTRVGLGVTTAAEVRVAGTTEAFLEVATVAAAEAGLVAATENGEKLSLPLFSGDSR